MNRRLNAYEKRKANRALKRRSRYLRDKELRNFEKVLERQWQEQVLKDAQFHEEEIRSE